jgi:hypothetical protein
MVIKNYTFEAEPVLMDFHDFRHCTFRRCRLIYCGHSAVTVDSCRFEDCRWEFGGPAMATLQFLANLYQGGSDMGKSIAQQAISLITQPRTGATPAGAGATAPVGAAQATSLPATGGAVGGGMKA